MSEFSQVLSALRVDELGGGLIEYALIAAFVAIISLTAIRKHLHNDINNVFEKIDKKF